MMYDKNASTNVITQLKSHVVPHYDHCNLVNTVVPLTTPLAFQRYV